MKKSLPIPAQQRGIVLVEALVAVLLFSMGILALVGLQGTMIKNTDDSKFRSEASYAAQQVLGQMWIDPGNLSAYAGTTQVLGLPSGSRTIVVSGTSVTVTLNWRQPGKDTHQYTAIGNIAGN